MKTKYFLLAIVVCWLASTEAYAQKGQPIILEHADSLVGTGGTQSGVRECIGNVYFRQGNVTVACDRAIQNLVTNRADLFGNVVVTQQKLVLTTPRASYDGATKIARAYDGMRIVDGSRILTARHGTYNTSTQFAEFADSVIAIDDTLILWSQRATYDKTSKVSTAAGNVVAVDSGRGAILRGDTVYHDPRIDYLRLMGDAAIWQRDTLDSADTTFILADTIESHHHPREEFIAVGNVEFVRGSVAAIADSLYHDVEAGTYELHRDPALWADSTQLHGDTILLKAPSRKLERITGLGQAILVSNNDTVYTNRYDQVAGDTVYIRVQNDSIRDIRAYGAAQSITWKAEEGEGEGLAKFASDTIIAVFEGGQPVDIYWLTGVVGEHHPEPVVAGREDTYKLSVFEWLLSRPKLQAEAVPWTPSTLQRREIVETGGSVIGSSTKKK